MTKDTADTPAKAEPKTVKMVNDNRSNGLIGAVASVAAKDVSAWIAKGWSKAK